MSYDVMLMGMPYPIRGIKVALFLPEVEEAVHNLLISHGASLHKERDYLAIIFPEGTVEEELYPRLVFSSRYIVKFPDGWQVRRVLIHTGQTYLSPKLEDIPATFWEEHKELYNWLRRI